MDDERREYIRDRLYQETNEPESQAWRDELTPEELEYAARLDEQNETIVTATYSAILVREQVRARYRPQEIAELETLRDYCRLRLRDGTMYLARLGRDGALRLDEIDGVC